MCSLNPNSSKETIRGMQAAGLYEKWCIGAEKVRKAHFLFLFISVISSWLILIQSYYHRSHTASLLASWHAQSLPNHFWDLFITGWLLPWISSIPAGCFIGCEAQSCVLYHSRLCMRDWRGVAKHNRLCCVNHGFTVCPQPPSVHVTRITSTVCHRPPSTHVTWTTSINVVFQPLVTQRL